MAEEEEEEEEYETAGAGIDRTVIRQLLVLTPGQRMLLVDNDARVLAQIDGWAGQLRRR